MQTIIFLLAFMVVQLELLFALALAAVKFLKDMKQPVRPEVKEPAPSAEEERQERALRESMERILAYDLDTARRAARGDD